MIYLEKYSDFIKGILITIGGSESRGSEVDINNSILSEVIKNSKYGIDSNIIIIPTASSFQNEIDSEYRNAFEKIGEAIFIRKGVRGPDGQYAAGLRCFKCGSKQHRMDNCRATADIIEKWVKNAEPAP